ncbi:hypothetical protein [Burkholderia sp. BCC1972]|uniref:hypothetical protein n=1 Tax=Burkholderia sp. BCC1972 TaxID=2817438 RepID=UPI002ABDF00A|nr:hypothetical protein [Burkholderia sp. BCC1972]
MKLRFLRITPKAAEWAWHVASWIAIGTAICLILEGFVHASAKIVALTGIFSVLAMCITYIAGNVRERVSRTTIDSARFEIERLRNRTERRNLSDGQRAALVAAAKAEGAQNIWVPHVASDHEASEYAKQLRDAFAEAGWSTGYAAFQVGTPIYGLMVGMGPPFSIAPARSEIDRVRRVLANAGIASTETAAFPPQSPAFGWSPRPHPGPNAAVLLVASKASEPDQLS